jgi:hypothetical protein
MNGHWLKGSNLVLDGVATLLSREIATDSFFIVTNTILLPNLNGASSVPTEFKFCGLKSRLKRNPEPVFLNVYGAPGIDSKEWIPPAYVAWRVGPITLFLLGS